jgi:hypothetical protein
MRNLKQLGGSASTRKNCSSQLSHERNLNSPIPLTQGVQPRSAQWLNRIPIKTNRTSKADSRVGQSVTTTQAVRLAKGCRMADSAPLMSQGGLFWGGRQRARKSNLLPARAIRIPIRPARPAEKRNRTTRREIKSAKRSTNARATSATSRPGSRTWRRTGVFRRRRRDQSAPRCGLLRGFRRRAKGAPRCGFPTCAILPP